MTDNATARAYPSMWPDESWRTYGRQRCGLALLGGSMIDNKPDQPIYYLDVRRIMAFLDAYLGDEELWTLRLVEVPFSPYFLFNAFEAVKELPLRQFRDVWHLADGPQRIAACRFKQFLPAFRFLSYEWDICKLRLASRARRTYVKLCGICFGLHIWTDRDEEAVRALKLATKCGLRLPPPYDVGCDFILERIDSGETNNPRVSVVEGEDLTSCPLTIAKDRKWITWSRQRTGELRRIRKEMGIDS